MIHEKLSNRYGSGVFCYGKPAAVTRWRVDLTTRIPQCLLTKQRERRYNKICICHAEYMYKVKYNKIIWGYMK